ncbi:uncharacterized protein LOC110732094 [Chenopodium quinoa]|uniref:uncharacterized protein LOC110732094 n=1 Tax=Chenopodium quinoa TaxID=63459 RepID=UPI000B79AC3E|nr:uncharacterized protein LOC110732094 [Chenopodium quinoa]
MEVASTEELNVRDRSIVKLGQLEAGGQGELAEREAVVKSSQWFKEARKIVISSLDWEEDEGLENAVQFSPEKIRDLHKPWELTLIGKCLGIKVRTEFIAQRVQRMWNPKEDLETIEIEKGAYLFRFSLQDDLEKALFGGPWFVLDHCLMLAKWRPTFRPSTKSFINMAVRNRFSKLPVEYYEKEALYKIAEVVGKPVRVDYSTDNISKCRYARVCIEIELNNPLITKAWVGKAWQRVEYEKNSYALFYLWSSRTCQGTLYRKEGYGRIRYRKQ